MSRMNTTAASVSVSVSARRALMRIDAWSPGAVDERLRGGKPAFQVKRADQRLRHVAQHIVAVGRAIVAGLLAEANLTGEADSAGDLGTGLAADQGVDAAGELALRLVRKQAEEPGGGHEAEYAVAQEFQAFVVGVAVAGMG